MKQPTFHKPARRPFADALIALPLMLSASAALAADLALDVVGSWRLVSHTVSMSGSTFDSQADLLQAKPCAAEIRYIVNADCGCIYLA